MIKTESLDCFWFFCPGTSSSEMLSLFSLLYFCLFLLFFSLIFLSVAGCNEIFFLNVITEINFYY